MPSWLGEWRAQNDASNCAELAVYGVVLTGYACVYQLVKANDEAKEGKYLGATLRIAGFVAGSVAAVATMATKAYMPIVNAVASAEEDGGATNSTSVAVGHLTAVSATIGAVLITGNGVGCAAAAIGNSVQSCMTDCVRSGFGLFSRRVEPQVELQQVVIALPPVKSDDEMVAEVRSPVAPPGGARVARL